LFFIYQVKIPPKAEINTKVQTWLAQVCAPRYPVDMAIIPEVLICDDDESALQLCRQVLEPHGYSLHLAASGEQALDIFRNHSIDCVLTDYKLPGISGLDLLRSVHQLDPSSVVVIMTAFATVQNAVEAMKQGAFDYITKPFPSPAELCVVVEKGLEQRRLLMENQQLRRAVREKYKFDNIIGKSAAMQPVFSKIEKAAPTDSTILIRGESGVGKELVARALHQHSKRKDNPFVRVNCSAFTESLLESELFGHEKGAFTGASREAPGLIAAADGGTLFLDEVGDMGTSLQAHLLRVLQNGEYRRVGETRTRNADLRVITATNQPLERMIREGSFREDLYYRLKVIDINIPPLRERMDDLPLLERHFLAKQEKKQIPGPDGVYPVYRLDTAARRILRRYSWPGNVRELENTLERACVLCEGHTIRPEDLPEELLRVEASSSPTPPRGVLELTEAEQIREVLKQTGGHRSRAADILGITRRTLYQKIKRFEIDV
jgi:DNA-binding NtrC family response regulator